MTLPAPLLRLIGLSYALFIAWGADLDILTGYGDYNEQRLLLTGLLLLGATLLLLHSPLRTRWLGLFHALPLRVRQALLLLLTLGTLSSTLAPVQRAAFLELALFTLIFITILLVALARMERPREFDRLFIITLTGSAFLYSWQYLSGYLAALLEPVSLLPYELFPHFTHIRFFGQFQSWTLPLLVLPLTLYPELRRSLRLLALLTLALWWLLLLSSATRGSMLGLALATAGCLVIFGAKAHRWLKWQLLGLGISGGLFVLLFFLIPTLLGIDIDTFLQANMDRDFAASNSRLLIWQLALQMYSQAPLFGAGPMHYACNTDLHLVAHPHSSLIQIFTEWGPASALICSLLVLYGLSQWFSRARQYGSSSYNGELSIALSASLLTALGHSMVSGVIVMPMSQMMMILVGGWMFGVYWTGRVHVGSPHTHRRSLALAVILIASFGTLIYGMGLGIKQAALEQQVQENRQLKPRFWQDGEICPPMADVNSNPEL